MSSSIWIPNIWIYKARILLELLGVFLTNPHPITILGSDARGRWRHLELVSFLERQLTWKESCTNFKQLTPQALFRSVLNVLLKQFPGLKIGQGPPEKFFHFFQIYHETSYISVSGRAISEVSHSGYLPSLPFCKNRSYIIEER